MHDDLTFDAFEARFAEAYGRFLADAPVEVDAVQVAATAAEAGMRRGIVGRLGRPAWLERVPRRTLVLAAVAMLVLAMTATLLFVGSLINQRPLGGTHLFLTTGALDCQDAIRFEVQSAESETIAECANRLRIAPTGTRAAAIGTTGIEIIDLATGAVDAMPSAQGSFTIPAAWSPAGTYLHWVSCDANTEGCEGFIGRPGSATTNEIPEPSSGFNGSIHWSVGETAFFLSQEDGVYVAAGDGSGLRLNADLPQEYFAISPDGLTAGVMIGRQGSGESAAIDLFLQPLAGGGTTRLTENPDGWFVRCSVWAPDASSLALLVVHQGTFAKPEPTPVAELHVVSPQGTLLRRWPLPTPDVPSCDITLGTVFGLAWAPDGRHVLVTPVQVDENPPPDPFVVNVATGRIVALDGLERPAFSPDGLSVAALGGIDNLSIEEPGTPATIEIVDLETGTTRSLADVSVGPWSVLAWAP